MEKAREFDAGSPPVNDSRQADGEDGDVADFLTDSRGNPTYTTPNWRK